MPDTPPYSEATVRVVAEVRHRQYDNEFDTTHLSWKDFTDDARAVLAALAAAGRLLPEGAETQWGLRRHDRESVAPYASREVAERWQGVSQPGWHLVSRPVGPWSAVPPEPKEGAGGQPSPA